MLTCPICDQELETKTSRGWQCRCGEEVPHGFERDNEENCENCLVRDCPRRK
jgi:hypothetical protein